MFLLNCICKQALDFLFTVLEIGFSDFYFSSEESPLSKYFRLWRMISLNRSTCCAGKAATHNVLRDECDKKT